MIVPEWVIGLLEAATVLALVGVLVAVLIRAPRGLGPTRFLLLSVVGILLVVGVGNTLEWTGVLARADIVEDFLEPLLPVLWLFLFVVELERGDRGRLTRGYDRMVAVHTVASKLTVTMEPQAIMDEIVRTAARLFNTPFTAIYTPNESQTELVTRAENVPPGQQPRPIRLPRGEDPLWNVMLNRRSKHFEHPDRVASQDGASFLKERGIKHSICVPLLYHDQALGVLCIGGAEALHFSEDDVAVLETLGAHAAVAVENARLFERVVESEAKYRVLVENAEVAISVADPNGRITFWNRGAERLFGWTAEEAVGQDADLIFPGEKRNDAEREILEPLERDGYWIGEHPLVRKDGSRFIAFWSLSHVFDAGGHVICTLAMGYDATEQVHLREQLVQAQKMETVGTLASGIAHDFNNLLTGIGGFANLLRASLDSSDENYESAVAIDDATRRGTELVRQLMTFSQKQPTRTEPVRLNAIVEEVAALTRRTFPAAVHFRTDLAPDLRTIEADATQMHQVLMNLAVNARDAMPEGGDLTIASANLTLSPADARARGLEAGPYAQLSVSDTGGGIPPQIRSRIFEPFFTTRSGGGGIGLGLSVVYGIVTRHGGCITCHSEPGQGTTFRILLPVRPPAARPKAPAPAQPPP